MTHPTRRHRGRSALTAAATFAAVVAALAAPASATIMGVDLGSESIKIAAPKNKAIDIVLNEQSHRKTANFVGFRGKERYFGPDAQTLAARFPDNMLTMVNRLVGVAPDSPDVAALREKFHYAMTVVPAKPHANSSRAAAGVDVTGTSAVETGSNPKVTYTAEELQAMVFGFMQRLVKGDTGAAVRDAVVTVPGFYTRTQRRALIDSAALAGVNVVATIHATTAAALQYGMQNGGFGNETHRLLVFDMGATKTDVGVFEFTGPDLGKSGKKRVPNAIALGNMRTLTMRSLPLGGRSFDACMAEMIEERFMKEKKLPSVLAADNLQRRKALISLMRAAQKAKEVLTANRAANVVVEGVAPGRDFATRVTRQEFEERCAPLFEQAGAAAKEALAAAGGEAVDAFELMGGGPRIPKLKESLAELWGKRVAVTINGDEAAAVGAAYYGGSIMGRFRMKFFALDEAVEPTAAAAPGISFSLTPKPVPAAAAGAAPTDAEPAPTPRKLFVNARIGATKSITVNRTADFGIHLHHVVAGAEAGPETPREVTFNVTGVNTALSMTPFWKPLLPPGGADDKENDALAGLGKYYDQLKDMGAESNGLRHPNNSHTVKITLRVADSGLVVVEAATVKIRYVHNVSEKFRVNLTDADFADAQAKARSKQEAAEDAREKERAEIEALREKEAAEEKAKTGDAAAPADAAEGAKEAADEAAEKKDDAAAEGAEAKAEEGDDSAPTSGAEDENKTADGKGKKAKKAKKPLTKEEKAERRRKARAQRIEDAVKRVKSFTMKTRQVEEMTSTTRTLTTAVDVAPPTAVATDEFPLLLSGLQALDAADKRRRDTAKARNDFEAFVYWVRTEGILENPEVAAAAAMTPEDEAEIRRQLANHTQWIDEEIGDATTLEDLQARHADFKATVRPVRRALRESKKKAAGAEAGATKASATKAGSETAGSEKTEAPATPETQATADTEAPAAGAKAEEL